MLITRMKGRNILMKFSHIYVEKDIKNHSVTINILKKLKKSTIIEINRYGDVFNRPKQNYIKQKRSQNLIIAKKRHDFIYKGSKLCENYGYDEFYHTSNVLNCIYDCEYCYLQGLYSSGYIVVFVNIEDFFKEVDKLACGKRVYLSISYESDLMAFEPFIGFASKWIKYASKNPNILIEIRTKSANIDLFNNIKVPNNVIFAWSLLPDCVIKKYERITPPLDLRLKAIKKAISFGYNVRISIEPIMYIDDFEIIYRDFLNKIFSEIDSRELIDVNIGTFRMVKDQAKRIEKLKESSLIFCYATMVKEGVFIYENEDYIKNFVYDELTKYIDKNKIYLSNSENL